MIRMSEATVVYENGTRAVNKASLRVDEGEFVFLVGASGSGKTTIIKLLTGEVRPSEGRVIVNNYDIGRMKKRQIPYLRRTLGVVYQDFRLINTKTVYENVAFAMRAIGAKGKAIKQRVPYVLDLVGLADKAHEKPMNLSGGEQQRVAIARALVNNPRLIIADEPTTALDVTVQKQVIALLNELREKLGFAMIFVSHDLALVAEVASEITVMYAGQVVESAPTKELLTNPIHEYTQGLLGSVLSIEAHDGSRLHQVPGSVPSPADFPKGDRFAPRSSHPTVGLDVHPVLKLVPGVEHHFVAEIPDEELAKNGLVSRLEVR